MSAQVGVDDVRAKTISSVVISPHHHIGVSAESGQGACRAFGCGAKSPTKRAGTNRKPVIKQQVRPTDVCHMVQVQSDAAFFLQVERVFVNYREPFTDQVRPQPQAGLQRFGLRRGSHYQQPR